MNYLSLEKKIEGAAEHKNALWLTEYIPIICAMTVAVCFLFIGIEVSKGVSNFPLGFVVFNVIVGIWIIIPVIIGLVTYRDGKRFIQNHRKAILTFQIECAKIEKQDIERSIQELEAERAKE